MTSLTSRAVASSSLVGASGSGKSTFAPRALRAVRGHLQRLLPRPGLRRRERPGRDQDAFDVLDYIAGKRLAAGRLTVVDATNVQREAAPPARRSSPARTTCCRSRSCSTCPSRCAVERNAGPPGPRLRRPTSSAGSATSCAGRCAAWARRASARSTSCSGATRSTAATIVRERLLNDRRDEHGPFDVIGDVHGCRSELETLLDRRSATRSCATTHGRRSTPYHPAGARPSSSATSSTAAPTPPACCAWSWAWSRAGHALAVPGNHENKLVRALRRPQRQASATGSPRRWPSSRRGADEFRRRGRRRSATAWSPTSSSTAAGWSSRTPGSRRPTTAGRPGRVRTFALYGDTTGETDEYGLPVRYPWANDYRGRAMVLYGHTPTPEPEWVNNTMCLDTGCVFGGKLTALRYPEQEVVAVPAERGLVRAGQAVPVAADRQRPASADPTCSTSRRARASGSSRPAPRPGHRPRGERRRRARGDEPVRARPALAAVPAADDGAGRHLARAPDLLEHPDEAFAAYAAARRRPTSSARRSTWARGPSLLVCRDAGGADRFGATAGETGAVYTRTGRSFFDPAHDRGAAGRASAPPSTGAGLWDELDTDWLLLDAELLPWSAKAEDCCASSTPRSARPRAAALPAAVAALEQAAGARRRRRRRWPSARRAGGERRRLHRAPTGATAGRPTASTACSSRRSSCSPREGATYARPRPRLAPGDLPTGSSPPTRSCSGPPGGSWSTRPTPTSAPPASPGGRS